MNKSALTDEETQRLLSAAGAAWSKAYAPKSGYRVGAAVLTERGGLFAAANVENPSYSLTMCAERAAVFKAVSEEGETMRLRAIALASEDDKVTSPCGACRQVLVEFGPDAEVMYGPGSSQRATVKDLLPDAFDLS